VFLLWYAETAMLITQTERRETLFSKRSLNELMALYEANYRRLKHLIPDLGTVGEKRVSRVANDLDLHLEIIGRAPYTTILSLTYYFESGKLADPAARIRIYHDARLVEVESCRFRQPLPFTRIARPGVRLPMLEWKWEVNLFFEKWLLYCVEQGHDFTVEAVASSQ